MVDVIIPLYKPGNEFYELLEMLFKQTLLPDKIILMVTEEEGFDVNEIKGSIYSHVSNKNISTEKKIKIELYAVEKSRFDHGGTRHDAVRHSEADILLFMTQDASPLDDLLIEKIVKPLSDTEVAAVYARQIAREEAEAAEIYTRLFNYPKVSVKKSKKDIEKLGIKTYFCSNVCTAIRRSVYDEIGGFQRKIILNEDMVFASEIINRNYSIYYNADARVYHSHNYSWTQQFMRNFDIGVSQQEYKHIFDTVSSEKEGVLLVKLILEFFLDRKRYLSAVDFIICCICRYTGYLLGKKYYLFPKKVILFCSMNKAYWRKRERKH